MKLNDKQIIYVRSMGKALNALPMLNNDKDANHYMETHKDEGVIALFGDYIFIANYYDHGVAIA